MEAIYKIIGIDGHEYGPVTLEELHAWVQDGRVAPYSQIWRADLACWRPASALPELQFEIGQIGRRHGSMFETAPVASATRAAGFWIRLLAFFIDQIPLMLVVFVIAKAVGMELPQFSWPPSAEQIETFLNQNPHYLTIVVAVSALYYIPLTACFGVTLGKLVFGMRVVKADGSAVSWKESTLRFIGMILNNLTYYVGYLLVGLRTDKRGLHDLVAGTRVVFAKV